MLRQWTTASRRRQRYVQLVLRGNTIGVTYASEMLCGSMTGLFAAWRATDLDCGGASGDAVGHHARRCPLSAAGLDRVRCPRRRSVDGRAPSRAKLDRSEDVQKLRHAVVIRWLGGITDSVGLPLSRRCSSCRSTGQGTRAGALRRECRCAKSVFSRSRPAGRSGGW